MHPIALPPCRGLAELAEATGCLAALLPREPCPPPDQFIRRGEIGAAGHFFYGPRFPLPAGQYLIWFWLRVGRDASSPRLVFDAVDWDGDDPRSLGTHTAALRRGGARTVIYPLWIETAGSDAVELRAWSEANSGDFRALGVDVRRVVGSPPKPARPAAFRTWRWPKIEGLVKARPDFAELWLAFDPHRAGAARFTVSQDRQPGAIIEVPDPAATAPFVLADGRLLLSLGLPAVSVAGRRLAVSLGGRTIDLATIESRQASAGAAANSASRKLPRLAVALATLDDPSPRSIEIIALEAQEAATESAVAIMELWSDFPLVPAESERAMVGGRFVWDAASLRLRHGFARFPAGRFPALRLGRGPSGGRCTIRHKNRDIELDLHAPEPGFLLVFPTLAEPVLGAKPGPLAADAIHPALEHMFARLRGSWLDSAAIWSGDRDG